MNADEQIEQLIAYVEGQLSPDERAAFERELAASPALRQQLQLMQHTDDSIVNSFAAPGFVKVDFNAARAAAAINRNVVVGATAPWKRWAGLIGTAVAAAVLVVAAIQFAARSAKSGNELTVSMLYDSLVKGGFQPTYVCKDDAEFIEYSQKSFGLPLLAQSDSTVQIVGWTYADTGRYKDLGISGNAKIILARVDEKPVILLLDKGDADGPRLDKAAKGRLNIFETHVGGIDIFEITPLDKPVAAGRFVVPGT